MAVTGRTYAQQAAADPPVASAAGGVLLRVNEDLITLADLITSIISIGGLHVGNEVQSTADDEEGLIVKAFDNSPLASPFRVELDDGSVLLDVKTTWNSAAQGILSARNVLSDRLWITTDQTEPAWANGQFWLRPRVIV